MHLSQFQVCLQFRIRLIINQCIYVLGSHTGDNIKKQYDEVVEELKIGGKIFKIIADQAANIKKAFKETIESNETLELIEMTKALLFEQKQKDLLIKQAGLRENLEKEIDEMNKFTGDSTELSSKKRSREQLYADFDEFEDFTDTIESESDNNDSDDSLGDAEELEDDNLYNEVKLSN